MHTTVMKYTYSSLYGTYSSVRYSNLPFSGIERNGVHFEIISVEYEWLGNDNRESAFRQLIVFPKHEYVTMPRQVKTHYLR